RGHFIEDFLRTLRLEVESRAGSIFGTDTGVELTRQPLDVVIAETTDIRGPQTGGTEPAEMVVEIEPRHGLSHPLHLDGSGDTTRRPAIDADVGVDEGRRRCAEAAERRQRNAESGQRLAGTHWERGDHGGFLGNPHSIPWTVAFKPCFYPSE